MAKLSFWSGQPQQFLIGIASILIIVSVSSPSMPEFQFPREIWRMGATGWFTLALVLPVLHQVVIAPLWRAELIDQRLTAIFGTTKRAFLFFKVVFSLFFFPRLLIAIPLSILTREMIGENQGESLALVGLLLAILLTPIIIYGMYSVGRYFGMNRAFGADHFFEEYRTLPRVDQGLFKYTSNAMYTYVLAITWVPALYLGSGYGFVAGLFNHLFVWVHYYFIEKPDMDYIYGQ